MFDDLLDLAQMKLTDLIDGTGGGNTPGPTATADAASGPPAQSVLDAVMRRLFDPRGRDLLTVSAFASAL